MGTLGERNNLSAKVQTKKLSNEIAGTRSQQTNKPKPCIFEEPFLMGRGEDAAFDIDSSRQPYNPERALSLLKWTLRV